MKEQHLDLIIVSDDTNFFNWIYATIQVSSLTVTSIIQINECSIESIESLRLQKQLLIIENRIYLKYLEIKNDHFSTLEDNFPLLLVTDSYEFPLVNNETLSIVDTISKPTLSIHTLEHAIYSVLKDYQLTQKLKKLAHSDALTGAANRYLFDDRILQILKRAKRDQEPFSLLYFDLNGFKFINDTYGHEVGDEFLKVFVEKLNVTKRETDTVARLGGDEFCMLLPNMDHAGLLLFVNRIKESLSLPFVCLGIELLIKSAIGGVNIRNQSTSRLTAKDILKIADRCVYEAKKEKETSMVLDVI